MKEQFNLYKVCEMTKLLDDEYSAMKEGLYPFIYKLYEMKKAITYLDEETDILIQRKKRGEAQRIQISSSDIDIVNEILSMEEEEIRHRKEKCRIQKRIDNFHGIEY